GGKNSLNRLIRCVCGKKIGPDPRNFNQRVSLGRNDLLIRTFLSHYLPDTVGEDLSLYFARESGVLLEGGLLFVDNGEGHIRLNLACPRTMLTAGMKRISQVLRTPAPNRV
ncbi:TPA: hypothetical protein ACIJNK_005213, partial [Klebsiella pneumoniae]|nr:hypothetical protein [Klebsiella pneumoniae]